MGRHRLVPAWASPASAHPHPTAAAGAAARPPACVSTINASRSATARALGSSALTACLPRLLVALVLFPLPHAMFTALRASAQLLNRHLRRRRRRRLLRHRLLLLRRCGTLQQCIPALTGMSLGQSYLTARTRSMSQTDTTHAFETSAFRGEWWKHLLGYVDSLANVGQIVPLRGAPTVLEQLPI